MEKYKISIYSMSGNIMKTFSSNNSLIQKIDLTDLSSGIYKIVFVSDKGIESTISISKM
ncbi:MAG: T9SS type A sorting domain-containing protein [Bacteroidales bacterium]|nr:T9SS type A sorting domain-containing protein [Bacteroidales bacterium]